MQQFADVAELVDALDLGSSDASHGGSSPSIRTKFNDKRIIIMNLADNMVIKENVEDTFDAKYKISIANDFVESKIAEKLTDMSKNIQLEGFRQGRVPKDHVKKLYYDDIKSYITSEIGQDAYKQFVDDKGKKIFGAPDVTVQEYVVGKPLEIDIDAVLLPEIKSPELKNLEIDTILLEVDDDTFAKEKENLQKHFAEYATQDRPIKDGDYVSMNYEFRVANKLIRGGSQENYRIHIKEYAKEELKTSVDQFTAILVKELLGKKAGDKFKCQVKLNQERQIDDNGKIKATVEVTVNEVLMQEFPEINEEFIKKHFAYLEEHTIEAWDKGFRQQIIDNRAGDKAYHKHKQVLDMIEEECNTKVSKKIIDHEIKGISSDKHADDRFFKDLSEEEQETFYRSVAYRRVITGFAILEYTNKHKISVSEDDVQGEIIKRIMHEIQSGSAGMQQIQALRGYYDQHKEAIASYVVEQKAIEHIVQQSKLVDKKMTVSDFDAMMEKERQDFITKNVNKSSKAISKQSKVKEGQEKTSSAKVSNKEKKVCCKKY